MLAGLVCGLTVLLLILSLFTRKEINTDILTANDNNRADVVTRVETRDFEDFVETAKVDKLIQTLNSLREVKTFRSDENRLANIKRQEMIVDSLMQKPLSDEHRQLAIMARIKNTSVLFWSDRRNTFGKAELAIRLREVTEKHSTDSDPEIAFESRIQLAQLNSLVASENPGAIAREFHQLLVDFPKNKRVHETLKSSLNLMVSDPKDRPETLKVLNQFFKLSEVKGDQQTEELYSLLHDLESLCELGFYDAFSEIDFKGLAGKNQLRDACLDLSKIPTTGLEIIKNLKRAARLMESGGDYQHAIDIYQAILVSAERLPKPKDVAIFRQLGNWGIKRCEAVGKPFSLATKFYDGVRLNPAVFKSMPVLIIFWSKSDGSEAVLTRVETESRRWRKNSVRIIAVQVERDPANFIQHETEELAERFPRWNFCYDDGTGVKNKTQGPLFSQIPTIEYGKIALLDRQHKLYDVNVNLGELVSSVNSVLAISIK